MTLHIHDTATRSLREFKPLRPGLASIYVCGATVQSEPHIGHMRSAIAFDILRRWLTYSSYQVTLVRNVTDIDDKILTKSREVDEAWWAWAYLNERRFDSAYTELGVIPPTYEPRATGHIPEMIDLMERLIESGHAYATEEGNVYFDVSSWPNYGALSGQRVDEMQGAETTTPGKRDPRDFALWKCARPGEPSWATPWGPGRPGWHLECSAMAAKYCGSQFDIHGGGLDLVFPHHENEIAQSQAAGDGFASYWMHNNWVTTAGEKMSKSLGNSLLVSELTKHTRPIELRYYMGAAHYRSMLEFSPKALEEAATGFRRIESFVRRATAVSGGVNPSDYQVPDIFAQAMDDDLGVPAALAVLHDQVTRGNDALARKEDVSELLGQVRVMCTVLGVDPLDPIWSRDDNPRAENALDQVVQYLLAERTAARSERDFDTADAIRSVLAKSGLAIEDGADGSTWSFDESGD